MKITGLRVDGLPSGAMFCASRRPAFSWKMTEAARGAQQKTYRLEAFGEGQRPLWDSGTIPDSRSAGIVWGGTKLSSRQKVFWRVTVCSQSGETAQSETAFLETPLFEVSDWSAKWIYFDGNNPAAPAPCPYFRKEFSAKQVKKARLYAACRGVMTPFLNGQAVGSARMAPGWSDFNKRIQYLSYDVTELISEGPNTLGAMVGDGWYCSNLTGRKRNRYGEHPELLLQLELFYADGTQGRIASGPGWRCATGPLLYSDIYDGEFYDARLGMPGWDRCGFDDRKWRTAQVGDAVSAIPALVPKCCLPVHSPEELPAQQLLHPQPDVWIWDFGQNITGVVRLENVPPKRNVLYTLRYGEALRSDGTLFNLNYRCARSTDYFIPGDPEGGTHCYETRFTFHGFRYVQIDGFQFSSPDFDPAELKVTAVVLHSELEKTSDFSCGLPELNRLWLNVSWSQRDNFLEIPTDCPQRDERLGWTGDAQIFCGTAALICNAGPFFRKYLADLRDAQRTDGAVPGVAPDLLGNIFGVAGWADAAVICPWTIYMAYGDPRILEENFDMMHRWVDYMESTASSLIRPETFFADWLSLSAVTTPSELIGTAYFARSAELAGRAAEVLGKAEEIIHYKGLASRVRAAFTRRFTDAAGLLTPLTQTGLALALYFELLPPELHRRNADALASRVRENGNKLDTGFIGTGYLNLALSRSGHPETAHALYLQKEYPSWLFPVTQGATTMWERWNIYPVKAECGKGCIGSFNHYAYGAVHEWVLRHLCGIDLCAPGGREVRFAAEPDARIGHAEAWIDTPYGRMESAWRFEGERAVWRVSSPPNTEMTAVIPQGWHSEQTAGKLPCGSYEFVLAPEKQGEKI